MNIDPQHPAPSEDMQLPDRFAFLLHLWSSNGQWRASVENLETGKRLGFSSLEHLFTYLMDLTEGSFDRQPKPAKEAIDEAEKRN